MTMEDLQTDNFPVGMRVLAVDDDPTCLKLLEGLLRRCDYQVTTTNQAIEALRLLRENKDHFDLVISDVHMPDMDGFKLLELVGLEMDLPVIMLSGHSDPKLVMRGITHGACDYLLKPVRIEELKNIWQHVIRKKKSDPKDNRSGHGHMSEKQQGAGEGGQAHGATGENDCNSKLNRKRKDQDEDDEDDSDGNVQSNEDPSAQKKPRVVWSVELHRKFVNAVNQLGVDKAVPKRILDLMNVEKLTRENVASHLQKYRLYLKRISNVATQQANMAAALGGKDLGYLPIGSFDGYSDLRAFTGTNPLPKHTLASYQASGVAGQLNSPSNLGLHGLPSTGMIQLGGSQTPAHLMNSYGKFPQLSHSGNQHRNPLQGMPHSLELDQLQHNKYSSSVNDSTAFPLGQQQLRGTGSYSGAGMASSNSRNTIHGTSDDSTMVQGLQQLSYGGSLSNQTSSRMTQLNSTTFGMGTGVSSCPPGHNRLNGTWQSHIPLGGSSSNALPIESDAFHGGEFLPQSSRASISSMSSRVENNSLDFSTGNVGGAAGGDARLLNFAKTQNNAGHSLNYFAKQELDDHLLFQSTSNTSIPSQNMGPTSDFRCASVDTRLSGQSTVVGSFLTQNVEIGKPNNGNQMMLKEHNPLEQSTFQNGFFPDNNESAAFDDLMTLVRRV